MNFWNLALNFVFSFKKIFLSCTFESYFQEHQIIITHAEWNSDLIDFEHHLAWDLELILHVLFYLKPTKTQMLYAIWSIA